MPSSRSYLLSADPNTPVDDPAIIASIVLQIIGGNVLIPIMVLAPLVQGNRYSRTPLFINFCGGWIAYSTSFLLSFYSGRWRRDVEPIPLLCEVEVLVYVVPVWTAAATLALIFDLWIGVTGRRRSSLTNEEPRDRLPLRTLILFIFPYFCATFMALAASLVSQAQPGLVGLRTTFCTIDFPPLRRTVSVLCGLGMASAFALQFDIGRHLYWKPSNRATHLQDWYHRALFVRMLIFTIIVAFGGLATIFAGTNSQRYPRQVIQSMFPLALWLVFGTNPAIYKRDSAPIPISKS